MKGKILIYEKDPVALRFLRSYFKKAKTNRAEFIHDIGSLRGKVSKVKSDNLLYIISSGEIKDIDLPNSVFIIATISGNLKSGIKNAIKHGAEDYILSPFHKEDLACRIRSVFQRKDERARHEKLIITDFLTGIYNIRYFYQRLAEEFSRSRRYNFQLSCLMLDIDYFKSVNDKYGHKAGDIVLKEFAQLLKRHARKSDVLARYGGEEFIMFLPQTNERGALLKAESVRSAVEKHKFHILKGKKRLTVSIGVSTYPRLAMRNMEDLISFADNSLYRAKALGRNRVVADNPSDKGSGKEKKH